MVKFFTHSITGLNLPRSMPMTWPFTFPSPSVEFHRLIEAVGALNAVERAREEVARGICGQVSVWEAQQEQSGIELTAREKREDSIFSVCVYELTIEKKKYSSNKTTISTNGGRY